ncbi:DNA polymerase I A, chloroplastic/mitochondrial [Eucalyptus grandis]|uniref:DNA polymerase I A, chloroplastic/mitochondrial n=1 Tax=Eucalyptus grandis TaxID=71139 RepID=UPI00192EB434|nr:DNA polymerase I A, chloroplastic/mitochondrial [Eucalyptus grandis]
MAMGFSTAQNAPLGPYCPSSLFLLRSRPRFFLRGSPAARSLCVRAETVPRGEFCQIQNAGDTTSRSSLLDGSVTGESKRYKYNSSSSARMVTNPMSQSIDYKNASSLNSGWKVATESLRNSKHGYGYKGHMCHDNSHGGPETIRMPLDGDGSNYNFLDCHCYEDSKSRATMNAHNILNARAATAVPFSEVITEGVDTHEEAQDLVLPESFSRDLQFDIPQTIPSGTLKTSHQFSPLPKLRENFGEKNLEVSEINGEKCLDAATVDATYSKIKEVKSVDTTDVNEERKVKLRSIYGKVLIVNNKSIAKEVVRKLTNQYKHLVHACDTEVAEIDVKQATPVDHGEITCFSIYSGPQADFGNGKSCIWVDVLDGGKELLLEFEAFFKDPDIKKVWHNYSFDSHIIENYGIKVSGFHADTMHMARLWNSSRRTEGGYSLEALTGDQRVISDAELGNEKDLIGKVSMKTIFGRNKVKKDGSEGKMTTIPPVEELQREERELWICYSALDAMSTLRLFESLRRKLQRMSWRFDGKPCPQKSMLDFYNEYWRPFGEILVKMEAEGMLVDRTYLAEIEKVAKSEQEVAADRFRRWASKYCEDAKYMNVGSDAQLRQLLFGGTVNRKNPNQFLDVEKVFKVPNVDGFIEEGKKTPLKYRNITLHSIGVQLPAEIYTPSGWPSVSGVALKNLSGKVSADDDFTDDISNLESGDDVEDISESETSEAARVQVSTASRNIDTSAYGTAFSAFHNEDEGREACHAIAALCEMCSIDSLISNFILPLQGSNVSGKDGRVHCSLNINTETGRLSARRPNLQNQPALEKDRYKIRQAFVAKPGHSLIVADYGQLELRILAHLADCKSMLDAFRAGGDFHSRTALNMYQHIREAVEKKEVLLEWHPQPGEDKPPVPLLKDAFGSERRKAKMLNFSIAYGKTPVGLARDWKVSVEEAKETVDLWYKERREVLHWQEKRKEEARKTGRVHTLLGRARQFPSLAHASRAHKNHVERAAINTPVQGSAADVAMCAMLRITNNKQLEDLGWTLLLQVHDEVILEGPTESAEVAKAIVVECMSKPFFEGVNILKVDLAVDAKCAKNWYAAK